MNNGLRRSIIIVLATESRFINLVVRAADSRGNNIGGRVDGNEGGCSGNKGRKMIQRLCMKGNAKARFATGMIGQDIPRIARQGQALLLKPGGIDPRHLTNTNRACERIASWKAVAAHIS